MLVCNLWDKLTETCLPIWLGRDDESDICLKWSFLSARHGYFILKKENGLHVLHYLDNQSTNRSSIDGCQIESDIEFPVSSGVSLGLG